MKAILFAVASMFVVTASVTPSLARPYYQDRAVTNFSHGFQSLSHRAYQGRSYWQTAYSAHHGTTASNPVADLPIAGSYRFCQV